MEFAVAPPPGRPASAMTPLTDPLDKQESSNLIHTNSQDIEPHNYATLDDWAREVLNPLRIEAQSYTANWTTSRLRKMNAAGVAAQTVMSCHLPIGVVCAQAWNDYWQPCEGGATMITVPVIESGCVIDIIAFEPDKPREWYLCTGHGWALGATAIEAAQSAIGWRDTPALALHSNPLLWLQEGCTGACVVQWTHEARQTLLGLDRIVVQSPRHAQRLRLELARPPRIPEIIAGRSSYAA